MKEPPTPQRTFEFEHEVESKLREVGRKMVEARYNAAEDEDAEALPTRVKIAGQEYRRTQVRRLLINLDNCPEIASSRTQFMKRLVDFSDRHQLTLELAYYPPCHSKYNRH